jgi:hypothetical protein
VLVMPRAESPLRPRAYSALRSQRCVCRVVRVLSTACDPSTMRTFEP